MNLLSWDATINQIAAETVQGGGKDKVLLAWRCKLEKEPNSLPRYQIDEIVREVRKRITKVSRHDAGLLRRTG